MITLKGRVRRTALPLLDLLVVAGLAQAHLLEAQNLPQQLAGLSGTGLTLTECQARMQRLDQLLQTAGYGAVRTHIADGRTTISWWYSPQTHMTVLAFADAQETNNTFSASQYTGLVRWNELLADH